MGQKLGPTCTVHSWHSVLSYSMVRTCIYIYMNQNLTCRNLAYIFLICTDTAPKIHSLADPDHANF